MMSFELPNALSQNRGGNGPAWSGAAFIVEAMLLLVFLIASFAIFTQMYAASAIDVNKSMQLSQAVAAATERAELFAHEPLSAAGTTTSDGMRVECTVTPTSYDGGTLYQASIEVYADGGAGADGAGVGGGDGSGADDPIYTIATSNYVSESEVEG